MLNRAAVLISIVMLCASCQKFAEGRQIFHDLLALRDQVATQFHEKVVDVNVSTNGRVTIKFINSPLNSAPHDVKQKRADEVAAFVISHYQHPVSTVSTVFASESGSVHFYETFIGATAAKP